MEKAYLLVNAIAYAALAIICTVRHRASARGTGYADLTAGGHSEFLTVYGGLQLGLAIGYFFAAWNPEYTRAALIFSVCLYAPIVLYRIISVITFRVRAPITLGTGALELVLFLAGLAVYVRNSA